MRLLLILAALRAGAVQASVGLTELLATAAADAVSATGLDRCGADGLGILSADQTTCCPARCGKCGGAHCAIRFHGSADSCCQMNIAAKAMPCGIPPCTRFSSLPGSVVLALEVQEALKAPPKCQYEEDQCGARWKTGADEYNPVQQTPYTTCCQGVVFGQSACKALPIQSDNTWGTACFPFNDKNCLNGNLECEKEIYAFTPFGSTRNQVCCKVATHDCVQDPDSKHYGSICVARVQCAKGQDACGRSKKAGSILQTADNTCCPCNTKCYTIDTDGGGYKTKCLDCAVPCGRDYVNKPGIDTQCCLPRQTCIPSFHGAAEPDTTHCAYDFPCSKDLCKNGGKCRVKQFPYAGQFDRCDCAPGFKGVFCDKAVAATAA